MSKKGSLFYDIKNLTDDIRQGLKGWQGSACFAPTLQSDYTIAIIPNFTGQVNSGDYESVLIQSLTLPFGGYKMSMDKLGMQSADFEASGTFSFSYVGTPYQSEEIGGGSYTSIIHYYYGKRFTENGLLKPKTKSLLLPAVLVINLKTNNIVYLFKDCNFSYPKFSVSPQSNSISLYETTVSYSSYKEYLFDDLKNYGGKNYQHTKQDEYGNAIRDLRIL